MHNFFYLFAFFTNDDIVQLLSTCLNAMCLALMDSGIAMHHLFAAISCAVTEMEEYIINPDVLQINVRVYKKPKPLDWC